MLLLIFLDVNHLILFVENIKKNKINKSYRFTILQLYQFMNNKVFFRNYVKIKYS